MDRPRLMSVSEAAQELHVSDAYVRRLLLNQRLYGIKIGPVWALFPNDLDAFRQLRRPPGRPPKVQASAQDQASAARVATERKQARTNRLLRKRGRSQVRE
jgi:excisionase family DNA binding protein